MDSVKGLLLERAISYIDHIAPFCLYYQIPLVAAEQEVVELLEKNYPSLPIEPFDPDDVDTFYITCHSRPILQSIWGLASPLPRTAWLPHGQSDKGWRSFFFEGLQSEQYLLAYGPRMLQVFAAKGLPTPHQTIALVGDYRWRHHLATYPPSSTSHRRRHGRTFLYAPTWDDSEGGGTFLRAIHPLMNALPDTDRLWIKLHPKTWHDKLPEIEQLKGRYADRENVQFLEEGATAIYSLLAQVDVYIGDRSSIGYDFLHFDRPLRFLHLDPSPPSLMTSDYLFQCGKHFNLKNIELIFTLEDADYSPMRQALLRETFASAPTREQLLQGLR
jgi:hypothetical protein